MTVKVDGLDELIDDFDSLNKKFKDALENDIGPEVAQVMYGQAVKNAPVDTGRLRGSLTSGKAIIKREDGSDEVFIGATTNIEYASYVEYGTGTKGDPAVPHVPKSSWWAPNPNYNPGDPTSPKFIHWFAQSPNPFMGRALEQTEKVAIKMMAEGLESVFDD